MKQRYFPLIIASILFLSACSTEAEVLNEIPDPVVRVLDLSERPSYQISEIGQIKAVQEVELIAKATGTISQMSHKVGDPVASGTVLAVIAFDELNNPARVNYDNAQIQLANAQQNYNQVRANNQDSVTRANLRLQSLETSLGRLQRNLNELIVTNKSTKTTLELQLANAEKNADTAEVNYKNILAQFEQSWTDLLKNTQTSLDRVFVGIESNFSTLESIINPGQRFHVNASDLVSGLGSRNSIQRNSMINTYSTLRNSVDFYQSDYQTLRPLNEYKVNDAVQIALNALDELRVFAGEVRVMLDNSIQTSALSQAQLDAYVATVRSAEASIIGDVVTAEGLLQDIADFKLSRTTQTATADNNSIIAANQLADARNALNKFATTSAGAVQDLEVAIEQTQNDLLTSQADLSSAYRSLGISGNSQNLEVGTLENQLKLAEKSLNDNKVVSSIDGTLSEFVVDSGDYITAGSYLGKVIQHEQVKIVFYVSKENAQRLKLGQPFGFSVDENGEEVSGVISKISPAADSINRKVLVEGSVKNTDLVLKPETYISLHLDLSDETFDVTKIYVPMNAIIFAQNSQYVYVVADGMAVRRTVEIGSIYGAWVEVTSGLQKTDLLITEGQRGLPSDGGVAVQVVQ